MLLKWMRALPLAMALAAPASADVRISNLPIIANFSGNEYLPLILSDGVTMRRATWTQIKTAAAWNQWRGAWSNVAAYIVNDVASYNGASYIAIQAGTNHLPTDAAYWSVIAAKGADGTGVGTVTSVTCGTGLSGGTFTSSGTCAISAPVSVANGGTNATAASGTALDNITGFASVGFLKRTGAGSYAFIADPIAVTNGGTGLNSGTSGGIPCFTAATTLASSAALGANSLVLGGGAGFCPSQLGSLGTTTQLLHGNAAGAPTWAALAYADIAAGAISSTAEMLSNTASRLATPNAIWGAGAVTALTDAATISVDMSAGINFSVTLAGNRTLGNPTNAKAGQSGAFRVAQDATGSRTLSYGANYKWAAGTACALSTAASKVDYIFYFVYSATEIMLSCALDVR